MNSTLILSAELLRTPVLQLNGHAETLHSKKGEAILYYLLVEKKVSRDRLASLIWAKESSDQARRHLRDTLYLLRKEIGDVIISSDRYTLQLNSTYEFYCDTDRLLFEKDVDVYQGEFLKNSHFPDSAEYELWVEQNRQKFRNEYLRLLSVQIQESLNADERKEALEYLQRYLQEEPTSESHAMQLMQLYRVAREYGKASTVYQRLYKVLSSDMGITPLKETTALYYAIVEEWNRDASQDLEEHSASSPVHREAVDYFLSELNSHQSLRGVIMVGDSGVGKTYVMNQLIASTQFRSYLVITASCYQSKAEIPLYPWQSVIMGLNRHVAAKGIGLPSGYTTALSSFFPDVFNLQSGSQKQVSIEEQSLSINPTDAILGIIQLISQKQPVCLVFSDLQWIDDVSLLLLDQLMRTLNRSTLMVLGTCLRETPRSLRSFLKTAQQDQLAICSELPPFTQAEAIAFVNQNGGSDFSEEAKLRIYEATGGNVSMLTQLLQHIQKNGNDSVFHLDTEQDIRIRTHNLSSKSLKILDMIALFQEYAPYEVLCRLSGVSSMELLASCKELCSRNLICQSSDGGLLSLSLSRSEYQEYLYAHIPLLEQQVMHNTIISILNSLSPASVVNRDTILEYQYRQIGDLTRAFLLKANRLITYIMGCYGLFRIGDPRLDISDNPETLIASVEEEMRQLPWRDEYSAEMNETNSLLLEAKSLYGISSGNYNIGIPAAQELLLRHQKGTAHRIMAHRQMASYAIQVYNLDLLEEHAKAGLESAKMCEDRKNIVMFHRYQGLYHIMRGDYACGRKLMEKNLEMIQQTFSAGITWDVHTAYAYDYIGDSYRREGRFEDALKAYETALKMVEPHECIPCRPLFHANAGQTLLAMGRYVEARLHLERALQHFAVVKTSFGSVNALVYLSLFTYADGDYAQTVVLLRRAEDQVNQFQSPRDRSLLFLVRAILRKRCDITGAKNEVSRLLDQEVSYYASQVFLYGRMSIFENALLGELFSPVAPSRPILSGLWNLK